VKALTIGKLQWILVKTLCLRGLLRVIMRTQLESEEPLVVGHHINEDINDLFGTKNIKNWQGRYFSFRHGKYKAKLNRVKNNFKIKFWLFKK
jgi:hypothetical protein